MSALETVAYEPGRREAFLGLMREVWGETLSPEEFDWWFERNPTGPRLISLVEMDGAVAAASAMSFLPLRLGDQEHRVAFAVHAATHPDFRGRGIWPALELHNEDEVAAAGAPAVLGFTNPVAGPILVGRLGWHDLASLRIWASPLRPSGRSRVRIEPLERFGPETDAIYREAAAGWGNHVVRTAEHLNWRYVDSAREYRRFAALRGDRVTAFAVVGRARYGGRSVAVLADLVAPPGAFAEARALLARCKRAVDGVRVLVALMPPGRAQRRAFLSRLFVPTHKAIRFIGKPLSPAADLPERRAAWHFSLGDLDIF